MCSNVAGLTITIFFFEALLYNVVSFNAIANAGSIGMNKRKHKGLSIWYKSW
jgi:hypothetical protein